jgi:hypothetical protein
MKRLNLLIVSAAGLATLVTATPAFAAAGDGSDAVGAGAALFLAFCWGLFALLALAVFVVWILMIVDAAKREEYEFPDSTGNTKMVWLLVLIIGGFLGFTWIVAPVYYFMVYKKIKRGTMAPPSMGSAPLPQGGYAPPRPAAPGAYTPPPPPPPAPAAPPAPPAPPGPPTDQT